jgi:hypothetical protein
MPCPYADLSGIWVENPVLLGRIFARMYTVNRYQALPGNDYFQ